jgi:REP element-mobilizing transposase RayT
MFGGKWVTLLSFGMNGQQGYRKRYPYRVMAYDPKKHHRRSIRLRGHNYSGSGAYFVTICAQDKQCLFGSVANDEMIRNEPGQIVQGVWEALPQRFPTVVLDAFQLMPNHLHGIFVIPGPGLEPSLARATGAPVIEHGPKPVGAASRGTASHTSTAMGDVVGAFKSISIIAVNRLQDRTARRLLQENFFEHIIRSVDELEKIRDYIRQNPARWHEDPENPDRPPGDWPETEWGWL